jgi:hypothetical protein
MSKRKLLVSAIVLMVIVGFSFAAFPFVAALSPSMRANAEITSININDMKPGSYKIATHSGSVEYFRGYKSSVMLVKRLDGHIDAWRLSTRNSEVGLPDYHWWQVYFDCKDFGPTLVNGVIDETKPICCRDDLERRYGITNNRWKWSIDGKALVNYLDDLDRIEGTVKGGYYVLCQAR